MTRKFVAGENSNNLKYLCLHAEGNEYYIYVNRQVDGTNFLTYDGRWTKPTIPGDIFQDMIEEAMKQKRIDADKFQYIIEEAMKQKCIDADKAEFLELKFIKTLSPAQEKIYSPKFIFHKTTDEPRLPPQEKIESNNK